MQTRWTVALFLAAMIAAWLAPALQASDPMMVDVVEVPVPAEPCIDTFEVVETVRTVEVPAGLSRAAHPLLLDPTVEMPQAPDRFRVRFQTTEGDFVVELERAWAPLGVDRVHALVSAGFYDGAAFFRVIEGFVAQFGVHSVPEVSEAWLEASIPDDPVVGSNTRGTLVFAKSGQPDSRTTQLYINLRDNPNLDKMGFAPLGRVVEGMEVVDALYDGYGEGQPRGSGPAQERIQARGDAYLLEHFADLDLIRRATIETTR